MDEEQNIISIITKLAEEVENIIDLKGPDKKAYVLSSLKAIIGDESYNTHYFIISNIIEFIVAVSKGQRFNINKKNLLCCIGTKKK